MRFPTANTISDFVHFTLIAGGPTVTSHVREATVFNPSFTVTVIVAVPFAIPQTMPSSSTEATEGSLDLKEAFWIPERL